MALEYEGFNLPNLKDMQTPTFDMMAGGSKSGFAPIANRDNMYAAIQGTAQLPGLTESVMPSIMQLLHPEGQGVSPYAKAIERRGESAKAGAQTEAMKRGITGSSIESGRMGQEEQTTQIALSNLYGQTANQLSEMIYRAASGDINTQRETLYALAQAMGQEITSERDLKMFREALQMSMEQANRMASSTRKTAIGRGIGTGLGAGAGFLISGGNPMGAMLGAQMGGGFGGSIGGSF